MGIFYHQFTAFGAAAQPMHAAAVQLVTTFRDDCCMAYRYRE